MKGLWAVCGTSGGRGPCPAPLRAGRFPFLKKAKNSTGEDFLVLLTCFSSTACCLVASSFYEDFRVLCACEELCLDEEGESFIPKSLLLYDQFVPRPAHLENFLMSLLGALSGVKSKHEPRFPKADQTKQGQVCVPTYLEQVLQEGGASPPGSPWQSCGDSRHGGFILGWGPALRAAWSQQRGLQSSDSNRHRLQ